MCIKVLSQEIRDIFIVILQYRYLRNSTQYLENKLLLHILIVYWLQKQSSLLDD